MDFAHELPENNMPRTDEGLPLTVFHGTGSDIKNFEDRFTFFTSDIDMAKGYALRGGTGAQVIAAHLTLKKPKVLDFLAPNTKGWYERKRRTLLNQGFDGVIIEGNVYAAFYSAQIKVIDTYKSIPLNAPDAYRKTVSEASDDQLINEAATYRDSAEWLRCIILNKEVTRRGLSLENVHQHQSSRFRP